MNDSRETLLALEETALRAWPAAEEIREPAWCLRFNCGYSKRANSAVVLGDTRGTDVHAALDRFAAIFADQGLPLVIRESTLNPNPDLTAALVARGYRTIDQTIVMTAPLTSNGERPPSELSVDHWLELYARFEGGTKGNQIYHRDIVERIVNPTCLAVLQDGLQYIAVGLGVHEDTWLGLFDIVTDPDQRRRGYGRTLVEQLMAWGAARGAERSYLQVLARNAAAIPLYESLGYSEAYRYQYWVA